MMRTSVCLLAVCFASACILRPPELDVPPRSNVVLRGVTVINPELDRLPGQQVEVADGRISSIAPTEGRGPYAGMYVLPGLIDMHTHFPSPVAVGVSEIYSLLHLAHGVTTIRDTGSIANDTPALRRRIRTGELPGPRMFVCGPALDGDPPVWPFATVVRDAAEARAAVEKLAAEGEVDCIKVYSALSPDALAGVRQAARRHDLPVVGHVPVDVPLAEVGIADAQHLYGVGEKHPVRRFADTWGAWDDVDDTRMAAVVRASLAQGLAHTPTLVIFEKLARLEDTSVPRGAEFLPDFYPEVAWDLQRGIPAILELEPADLQVLARALPKMRELVRRLHEAGVRIHAGSDCFMPNVVPGSGLHEELALLSDAGIALESVWALATWKAGDFLREPGLGRIAQGSPADLLVFREDPTKDLAALDTLELVIADGRVYTRNALQLGLARYADHVHGPVYETIMGPFIRLAYVFLR